MVPFSFLGKWILQLLGWCWDQKPRVVGFQPLILPPTALVGGLPPHCSSFLSG